MLETKMAFPKCEVFKLGFARGEFDMVVFDPTAASCAIYEIKHSSEIVKRQTRYLLDDEKCRILESKFGPISGKYVLYRGENTVSYGVQYLNVEQFLCELK